MGDGLLDTVNQYGGILGVIGIVVTIYIAHRSRVRKTLDFEVLNNLSFLSPGVPDSHQLSVHLAEAELKEPRLVTVRVRNTGNKPVVASDYVQPICIQNKSRGLILSATSVDEVSEDRAGDLVIDGESARSVSVSPELLNVREHFDVQLIIDGPAEIACSSRFVGQTRDVKDLRSDAGIVSLLPAIFVSGGSSLLLIGLGIANRANANGYFTGTVLISVGFTLFGFMLSTVLVAVRRRNRASSDSSN